MPGARQYSAATARATYVQWHGRQRSRSTRTSNLLDYNYIDRYDKEQSTSLGRRTRGATRASQGHTACVRISCIALIFTECGTDITCSHATESTYFASKHERARAFTVNRNSASTHDTQFSNAIAIRCRRGRHRRVPVARKPPWPRKSIHIYVDKQKQVRSYSIIICVQEP